MNRPQQIWSGTVSVAIVLAAALLGAQTPITPPPNTYTPAQDVELGQKAAADARKQLPVMRDDAVSSYLEEVGSKLVAAIPEELRHPEFRYTFEPVNVREINAFARVHARRGDWFGPQRNARPADVDRRARESLARGNPSLRRQATPARVDVGGRQGLKTVLSNTSSIGQPESIVVFTTQLRDGNLFFAVAVAPQDVFSSYRGVFDRIVSSIELLD